MRALINSTYVSLDGVVENPHLWPELSPADGAGEDGTALQTDLLLSCDAVLMGRRTYEGFAPAWQGRSGDPLSDRMNSMRKYVASTTLTDPQWANTQVIDRDLVTSVATLKDQPGRDIVQYGFGSVSSALLEAGLIDELRWWVHPLFVGSATADDLVFRRPPALFALAGVRTLSNGIVVLIFRP